ncbi:MAG: RND family transporter [Halolamina sp.]
MSGDSLGDRDGTVAGTTDRTDAQEGAGTGPGETVRALVVERPGRVALAFLLVSLVFAGGLGNVSTAAGTQQFAEDIPAEEALSDVNREFSPTFAADTGSTQLIQRAPNVLAKPALLSMLRVQHRLDQREDLRVTATSSAASQVARQLDPSARTLDAQIRAVERSSPADIDAAIRELADQPRFTGTLSDDFNREATSASATIGVVTHDVPGAGGGSAAGQGGSSPLTPIQQRAQGVVATVDGDITVFGAGLISAEFSTVITDSLLIVTPAAVLFIVGFLVLAYRDLLDLLLGGTALVMAIVWTFGFLGLAGIPFNQVMITIPPLLLAVGIDFGIHAVNRYREERVEGASVGSSMDVASEQLLVAFFIVTGTTVIGFLANLVSSLAPIRDFGVVAAVGIGFTFLIFGVFLPAAKVWLDRRRDDIPIPTFSQRPLGTEGSSLSRLLQGGVWIARRAPRAFVLLVVLSSIGAGYYATGVDTTFTQEDFLPPSDTPDYLESLPEPFAPSEYTVVAQLDFLEAKFTSSQGEAVTVYWETRMTRDSALEEIQGASRDPPSTFVADDRRAEATSLLTVIEDRAARDPEFRELVARNDRDGDMVPDRNLESVYDYLLQSSSRDRTLQYLGEDYRSTRVVYDTEADAGNDEVTADGRAVADRYRGDAIATGSVVVFQAVSDLILESAVLSLAVALAGTLVYLLVVYNVLEGAASLGIANAVPIVVAVAAVAGTMRLVGIPFNAFTATILALTIGLGIDYSVHVVHRFVDERRERGLWPALDRTVRGTGGALAGSMATTVFGIGVLVFAVLTVIGQFGVLTALSIVYSFLASLFVLPSVLVIWDDAVGNDPTTAAEF